MYEVENQRRSIAMEPPRKLVLDREAAMTLLAELYEALGRVRQLEEAEATERRGLGPASR